MADKKFPCSCTGDCSHSVKITDNKLYHLNSENNVGAFTMCKESAEELSQALMLLSIGLPSKEEWLERYLRENPDV